MILLAISLETATLDSFTFTITFPPIWLMTVTAKTKKQKRKIKVWWKQLNEEKQQVSGYEIARSRKRDSGYGIMFSSPTAANVRGIMLTPSFVYVSFC